MSHASSRAGRKRAQELTWEEVLVEIENPPALPAWATPPELFCALNAADQESFLDHFELSSHKRTLLRLVHGKPLPAPSDVTWKNVPRILEGPMPKSSTRKADTTGEMEGTVEDTFLEVLRGVFARNFRNVTEMEAVMRVGVVLLCAVKDFVQLQPSLTNHPTFTDFLFVVRSTGQAICFIEVKKSSEFTSLTLETPATAQALREAQANNPAESARLPFLLTNSLMWSFGVAEKRSSKIAVTSIVEMLCSLAEVMEWKTIIQTV